MQPILDFIKQLWQAFVDSGLEKELLDTIGNIITYTAKEAGQFMWDLIHALGG